MEAICGQRLNIDLTALTITDNIYISEHSFNMYIPWHCLERHHDIIDL